MIQTHSFEQKQSQQTALWIYHNNEQRQTSIYLSSLESALWIKNFECQIEIWYTHFQLSNVHKRHFRSILIMSDELDSQRVDTKVLHKQKGSTDTSVSLFLFKKSLLRHQKTHSTSEKLRQKCTPDQIDKSLEKVRKCTPEIFDKRWYLSKTLPCIDQLEELLVPLLCNFKIILWKL